MSEANALAKSWNDTLSAVFVGALALIVASIRPQICDNSRVCFDYSNLVSGFENLESLDTTQSIVAVLLGYGVFMAIGYFCIQFGELIAMLTDFRVNREKVLERVHRASENPILLDLYRNAQISFRLLCGIGGITALASFRFTVSGLTSLEWVETLIGVVLGLTAFLIAGRFARYSFSYLDWLLFGEPME